MINSQLKVCFIHIPRTGGRSFQAMLKMDERQRCGQHATGEEVMAAYGSELHDYTFVTIFRNPPEWMDSCARYLFAQGRLDGIPLTTEAIGDYVDREWGKQLDYITPTTFVIPYVMLEPGWKWMRQNHPRLYHLPEEIPRAYGGGDAPPNPMLPDMDEWEFYCAKEQGGDMGYYELIKVRTASLVSEGSIITNPKLRRPETDKQPKHE